MELTKFLTNWYKGNCDGDWEHSYAIKINTLDNPGWVLQVDLLETILEGKSYSMKNFVSEEDWIEI